MSQSVPEERYESLLAVVQAINIFKPDETYWKFCVDISENGNEDWKPFGIVTEETVKYLKDAVAEYFDFYQSSTMKQVRLKIKNDTKVERIFIDIRDKLNSHKNTRWCGKIARYGSECWPLLGAPEKFKSGILCDLVPFFGVFTSGAHLNIYQTDEMGKVTKIWLAKRDDGKKAYPGMLDQCGAGGLQAKDKNITTCMIRETKEELLGLPENWLDPEKRPELKCIQYTTFRGNGCKDGYDRLPDLGIRQPFDFELRGRTITPGDGQNIISMTIEEVLDTVTLKNSPWKPNSLLVMIHLLVRKVPPEQLGISEKERDSILELLESDQFPADIPFVPLKCFGTYTAAPIETAC